MVIGEFIFIVGVFPQEKAVNLHQARVEALIMGGIRWNGRSWASTVKPEL